MYTLYARPGAGSAAVEALLAVLGFPHRIEPVLRDSDGQVPADFFKINPLGEVPTLILPDGQTMTESAAILIFLADADSQCRYAPPPGSPLRPAYLRWMIYLAANCYMTDLRFIFPWRYTTDLDGAEAVKQAAIVRFDEEWSILAKALGDRSFLIGENLTAVDIYAAMIASWNLDVPGFFARYPNVERLYHRVAGVPAIAAVWARNNMPTAA